MAKKKYEEANIEAIADSIREKTGSDKTYKTKDMAEGVGEVYEAGKQAEFLHWFNAITANGTREYYTRAFYATDYTDVVFPEVIKPIYVSFTWYDYRGTTLPKPIDLSNIQPPTVQNSDYSTYQLFAWATKLKEIYDMGIPTCKFYTRTYQYCRALETIEMVRVDSDTVFTDTFVECDSLKNINFEGEIGKDIDFKHSPLSVASLKSIVKHLKNYSGTADHTQTLTVKSSAWEALEVEGLNDEDKAWLISLMPYVEEDIDYVTWATVVDFFSWNLVLAS